MNKKDTKRQNDVEPIISVKDVEHIVSQVSSLGLAGVSIWNINNLNHPDCRESSWENNENYFRALFSKTVFWKHIATLQRGRRGRNEINGFQSHYWVISRKP